MKRQRRRSSKSFVAGLVVVSLGCSNADEVQAVPDGLPAQAQDAQAQEAQWPREIDYLEGTLVFYQPQPESLEGNVLTGRAAASFTASATAEPVFGTLWFTSRIDADSDAGTADVRDIRITDARWPDATDEQQAALTSTLTRQLAETVIPISTERLSASLAATEREMASLANLNNDPPVIVFAEELTELLMYDGEPRTVDIEGTDLEQVVNAAFAVVKDGNT